MTYISSKLSKSTPQVLSKREGYFLLLPYLLLQFCEYFLYHSTYSYVGDLTIDLKVVNDKRNVGYFSGLVSTVFFVSQFIASYPFSRLSDKYGRKNVFIFSIFVSSVCCLFMIFTSTISPLFFGYYLMFKFFSGFNGNLSIIKTVVGEMEIKDVENVDLFKLIGVACAISRLSSPLISGFTTRLSKQYNIENVTVRMFFDIFPFYLNNLIVFAFFVAVLIFCVFYMKETNRNITKRTTKVKKNLSSLAMRCIAIYIIMGFSALLLDTAIPLFLFLPVKDKGLNFTNYEIGIVDTIGGVSSLIVQLIIAPIVIKKLKLKWSIRLTTIISLPFIPFYPELSYLLLEDNIINKVILWIILSLVVIIRYILNEIMFTSCLIIVNNSVKNEDKAFLNGIAQTLVGFSRSLSPWIGMSLLSITVNVNKFPFDVHFLFFLAMCGYLCIFFLTLKLPYSINYPFREDDDTDLIVVSK